MKRDNGIGGRIRIAAEVFALVTAVRALVTELRKGRRLHAGHAALKLAVAAVGVLVAIRAIEELDEAIEEGS